MATRPSRCSTPTPGRCSRSTTPAPNQDASLADGWLEGCEVECPLHASRFNLRTGAVDAPPAKLAVRTHRVDIEDDVIYVELSSAPPNLPPTVRGRLGDAL